MQDLRNSRMRVAVVADRQLIGDAVRTALASRGPATAGLLVPRTRSQMQSALRRLVAYQPTTGVVLGELDDPDVVENAAQLIQHLAIGWVVLSGSDDPRRWGGLVSAGAQGMLPLSATIDELVETLELVAAGHPLMTPTARQRVVREWQEYDERRRLVLGRLDSLSPAERDVLATLAAGRTVAEIAAARDVSVGTVRSQVRSVLGKVGVRSQLAAVAAYRSVIA